MGAKAEKTKEKIRAAAYELFAAKVALFVYTVIDVPLRVLKAVRVRKGVAQAFYLLLL